MKAPARRPRDDEDTIRYRAYAVLAQYGTLLLMVFPLLWQVLLLPLLTPRQRREWWGGVVEGYWKGRGGR